MQNSHFEVVVCIPDLPNDSSTIRRRQPSSKLLGHTTSGETDKMGGHCNGSRGRSSPEKKKAYIGQRRYRNKLFISFYQINTGQSSTV